MSTFEVDVAQLRQMAGVLKGLKEEFASQKGIVSGHEDAIGSDRVSGALNDFADNWSDKRKELSEMLEEVAGYALMAADAYQETESALSGSIEDSKAASGSNSTRRT